MNKRIQSIDIVRGIVMIIMALDHVRDLLHVTSLTQSPTDLNTTTPMLFFSRWITHLCAPTFVFLSGVSVYLSFQQRNDINYMRNFLMKRGLWLILLEITIINFGLWFDIQFRIIMLQVIAAIGVGFIILSLLLKASPRIIGIFALIIIFFHNLLQYIPPSENPIMNILRNILFTPGIQQVSSDFMVLIAYPFIPWIAIMLLGYSFGQLFTKSEQVQKNVLLKVGISAIFLFLVLRIINVYGDLIPWKTEKNDFFTILSFLNVNKYPPSLLFILLFLGIMFLLLRFSGKLPKDIQNVLSVYGRVPMFYYLIHFYLIRASVFIMVFLQGYRWKDLQFGPFQFGRPVGPSGISLGGVLLVWLLIVLILYPLCQWYGNYKKDNMNKWWLRYL